MLPIRKQIKYNGRTLFFSAWGSGPVVVLLHGFGESAAVWKHQVQALQKDYKVYLPDLPGTGDSELSDNMSLDGIADSIAGLLQAEKVNSCILIGHSMGGYIALAFAEKYGGMLRGLGLFHSSAFADNEEKIATRQKGIQFMKQHGAYEFLKTSIPNLYSSATKENQPALVQEHLSLVKDMKAAALISYYEAMMQRPDRSGILKNALFPVLIVLGAEDTAVPMEQGLKQCSLPNLSYIHILYRSGHMGMVEEPEKSNELLTGFVSFTLETTAT